MLAEVEESGPRCGIPHTLGCLSPKSLCLSPHMNLSSAMPVMSDSEQCPFLPNSICHQHDLAEFAFHLALNSFLIDELDCGSCCVLS